MKPSLKVGDKVIIRRDLSLAGSSDIPFGTNETMLQYKGQEAIIVDLTPDVKYIHDYPNHPNFDQARYKLDIDNSHWAWSNVMFENPTVIINKEEEILLCCTCS